MATIEAVHTSSKTQPMLD